MSLTARAVRGVKWTTFSQVGRQALQLITLAVLAKLLEEEDFGVMAMGVAIAEFVRALYYSFSSAIIQRADLDDKLLSSVHWFSTALGATFATIIYAAAGLVSEALRSPSLHEPLEALAVIFFFFGLTVGPQALLERNLEFNKVAQSEVAAAILASATGIALAATGFGVWALVFQWIALHASISILFWARARWIPKFRFDFADIRRIAKYSANLSGFHFINYFSRNADKLVVGRYLGERALGYYSLAYRMMLYSSTTVSTVVNRVMFPFYSRVRHDRSKFREAYLRSAAAIALLAFPMMIGIATISEEIVVVVFNPEWRDAVAAPLSYLALAGMTQSILFTNGSVFQATGRTDRMLIFGAITAALAFAGFIIGLPWGVEGVAFGYFVANALLIPPGLALSLPLIGLRVATLLKRLALPLLAALLMAGAVLGARAAISDVDPYVRFAALVGVGVVSYAGAAFLFCRRELYDLLKVAKGGKELSDNRGDQ